MLKESSVVAVAGARRLWVMAMMLVWGVIFLASLIATGVLIVALIGAVGVRQVDGVDIPALSGGEIALRLLAIGASAVVCVLSYRLAKRFGDRFQAPLDSDIRQAAKLVNDLEAGAKFGAASIGSTVKSALSETKNDPGANDA